MDNIVVADKSTEQLSQSAWGDLSLNQPSLVQLPVSPDRVANVVRDGQNLVVTLKTGEKVTLGNFFVVNDAGIGNDIVFVGEDGTLWHGLYDADAFTGFTFDDVASLDQLMAGLGEAGSATPTFAIAGLGLLGAGGAAAAAGGGGGGGGGGGAPTDTTTPAAATDLLVSADGLRLTGRGEAGSTVNVRDAAGNLIGSGTVGGDGSFDIALAPAQANGEVLGVSLTDAAGNTSESATVAAPDITAPQPPTNLAIDTQGTIVSGTAEPGATVVVRGPDGSLLGSGVVAGDGSFNVTLQPPQTGGQPLQVSVTDPAGNTSGSTVIAAPATNTPPDTSAPDAPTDLAVSAGGNQLSGRGEAGATVNVRDAQGNLIGSGTVGADGGFTLTLNPAQANGEVIDVRQTDAAGNTSVPLTFQVPDITAPNAPTALAVNADGTVLTGRAEPGSTVRVVDAQGNVLGTATVNAAGSFAVTLAPPQIDGQALSVTAQDVAGNTSAGAAVTAPDVDAPVDDTAPDAPTNLVVSPGGSQLSGRGEAGTTVNVRDAQGNLIGTGTVGADGSFNVALNPAVIDGSALQVDLTDAAGNVSQPGSVLSPDLTAPTQLTDLAVADGVTLTGTGEPGATVQVRDAQGNLIGTGTVGADGGFTLTLNPAQANGEFVDVRQTDAAGNTSVPLAFQVPDITAPAAVTNVVVGADGVTLSGRGEAGATVQVRDGNGNLIGTGTVAANGTFVLTLDTPVAADQAIALTQTDAAGNISAGLNFTVPATPAPASPTGLALNADGTQLSGTATPGNRVEARAADGTLLGSAVAAADGTFTITLQPPQANGEIIDAVAIDANGQSSIPASLTAPDITAPNAPTELAVNADGTVLTGRAEPGSTVRVVDAQGNVLGTATVNAAGSFAVTLAPPQIDGQALSVTAQDPAGNTSAGAAVTAPDLETPVDTTAPDAPTNLVISPGGSQLNGRGEAGTTVNVRDAQGNLIGTGVVAADGSFNVALNPAVIDGSALQVDLTDAAGNISQPGSIQSPDLTAPAPLTDLAVVDGVTLTGTGEPGASVQVRDAQGNLIGTGTVGADGGFILTLNPAQTNGEFVDVRQTDAAGNTSVPLALQVPDITAPAAVTNVVVGADGVTLSGRGEAGATVQVRDADGNLIGAGTVAANGTFVLTLDTPVAAGQAIALTQTDAAGNVSPDFDFTVPATPAPASPTGLTLNADGTQLSGTATPGNRVEARAEDGTLLGNAVAAADGTFTITLQPPQANGEIIDAIAVDANGQNSIPTSVTAPDITAPDEPTQLVVSADGTVLSGRGEPGSTVRVLDAQGNQIGSAVVNAAGTFAVPLDPPQTAGQTLAVTAQDAAGNVSDSVTVTAPNVEAPVDVTAPEAPVGLVVSPGGNQLSGRGEVGSTVNVRDAQGNLIGTGVVAADGSFNVVLNPAVIDGSALQVDLTDATGNVSQPGSVLSPDLTAPAPLTDLAVAGGVTLTGTGEPGATVQVRDAQGNLIGTGTVDADGGFTLTLNPAQANGEFIDVRQTDAAGNTSVPLAFQVPDITAPAAVTNVVVGADGVTLSGRGEAGATVQVRDGNGNLIGTGTVAANGTFVLTLDTPVAANQAIALTQTDAAGNVSADVDFTVPATPAPASPTGLTLNADGTQLSGTATPGNRVEARAEDGTLLGNAVAAADGTFTITLQPPQANGELIDAVAIDANGQSSIPTSLTAPDITAPSVPSELVVSADGAAVTGRGEPGSTVRVLDAQGNQIGSAVVNAAGSFAVPLDPPQTAGQALTMTAEDAAGNVSTPVGITAPNLEPPVDVTPPASPTDLVLSPGGGQLSGRGEAGTTVTVRDAQGNVIGTGSVAADGSFVLTLAPAIVDGSALQVQLTDAAGNASTPASIATPDLMAPAQPTALALADGTTLSGSGEPGATVVVRDALGNVIGAGQVRPDGGFTLNLNPAQANGEFIDVRQTDSAGNASAPLAFQAPDITAPAAITTVVVGADGVTLSGRGEAGATVQVRDGNGNLIGTGTVAANGTFVLTLDTPVAANQAIALTQTDAAGNVSAELDFTVPATPAPASPTGLTLNADGTQLSGTATPGNRVEARAEDGTLLGNAVAAADGTFTITLQPPQANGELIDAVAIDANGQSSIPTSLTAPDITAPSVPSELVVSADGAAVTGRGEPGSTVRVLDAQGNQIGSAVVNDAGSFTVPLVPAQTAGQPLSVTAQDAAGNVSDPVAVTAPNLEPPVDVTPPQAPLDLALTPNGVRLTGSGEANTQVQVRDAQGNLVASTTVGADGRFSLDLAPAVIDGSTLQVTLVDASGNVSAPTLIASRDLTAPEQPSDLQLIDGNLLSGAGEIGAQVEVRDAAGVLIGSGSVDGDGRFNLTLDTLQLNGEPLDVRLIDAAGNGSTPLVFQAPDSTAPDLVGNIVVSADGLLIAGRGEAGATVSVRDASGQLLANGVVGVDGNFLLPLTDAILPGSALTFVQTDAAGLTSDPVNYLVPLTPPPLSPSDLVLAADGSSLSGSATPGTTVHVRDANGDTLTSIGVGAEGDFSVVLDPPMANGEQLHVVVVHNDGSNSLPVPITALDITAPDAPSALAVSADGRTVIGRAEAGSQVQVRDAQGNLLGSAQANATGSFSVTLQPAQVAGQPLQVSATDNAGNTSQAGSVTAPQIDVPVDTTPPAAPTALAISLDGATLSGRGEVGTTVRVLNAEGQVLAEGQVALDGQFILDLVPAVIDGSALRVTLTDAAGNTASASLEAPDLTAPAQPTDLLLVDGQTLSGSAEAGARVEVRDADGTLVGQALVDAQGRFSLSLDDPLLDGEALLIEVIDGAGNRSTPLDYTVPDVTPPGLVLGVVVSVLDGLVAGRGEVGARVEVRDANGTLLGAAVVADNGTFLVTLDTAVAAGDALNLVQIDTAGNRSAELSLNVPDAAVLPSPANVVVAEDGASVSGTAPAGSQVLVRDAAGNTLAEARADAAGNFQLPLVPPLANGEDFSLVVVDATGNSSLPTPAVAPDITAPSAPSGLQLSADGATLNGRGEPGANVQVVGADGQALGNGVVNGNGSFSLVLDPAQVAGQGIDVILTDGAGNVSTPGSLTAPNLLGPLQPSGFAVDATGTLLTGFGQAGSTLSVRDIDGNLLGSATVDATGRFSLTLNPAQRNGEALDIEASDAAGNLATVTFAVPDIEPPLPVTQLLVSADGATVSGQGEAGATVTVRGPDGLTIGTALVAADGSFSVPLDTVQTNGQTLTVEQRDVAGNLSTPATVGAPDLEAPEAASALQLLPDGSVLIGVGEAGTTVTVRNADGVVGTAIVAEDGSFRVTLQPAQLNGQRLTVTLTDGGGNPSPGVELQAPDLQAPDLAAGLSLSVDGTLLSGTAEPGATVEVRTLLGVVLGDVLVGADGRFQVVLPAQINGQLLDVVVIDAQGNASAAVRYTADDTSPPSAPGNLQLSPNGNQLFGTGEVGSRVEVRNGAGTLLGQGVVQPGGLFVVDLAPLQNEGQTLQVTLTDAANNTSLPTDVSAPDTAPLGAPLGSVSVDGSTVSGTAVGAVSITLRDVAGLELITVPVQADGAFTATLPAALTNGELISLIAIDGAGLTSVEALLNAPDTTPPEAALNVSVSLDGASISGNAEPGSTVVVRNADGELGRVQVGDDGTFVVPLLTALLAGDSAELVVVDAAGNENPVPTPVDGPLGIVVETPSQLQLSADGFSLTGVGTAGCQISVVSGGVTLGTGTVGTDGTFLVFLRIAAFGGQTLQVNASLQGVVSAPVSLVAPDVTAPDAPLVTLVERDGTALSGRGEVGATVTVRDSGGALLGSAVVDATGAFSVALNPAPVNGETLLVRQADAAGNLSLAISANAPDITPPAIASGLRLNDAATVVSGQGESGALVTVRDANGLVLATGTVNQVGQFQITLPITQVSGAPLQITLTDRAGNTSEPVALATPDRTPPLAVGQLVLSADGSQLTGTGEPGASVRVRTPEGTLVGSATVADNGLFAVTLTPPQTTGLTLGVTQADAAGNLSPAIALTTPDLQPPASLSNLVLNNDGLTLSGLGQAGNTVEVRNAAGTLIGTGTVAGNGTFVLTLDVAQLDAERLRAVQINAGGIASAAVPVIAPDLTPPAAPSDLLLASGGLQLTGSAEAGSIVQVRDAQGLLLGTALVEANGTFRLTLAAPQVDGQALQVTATDAAGNRSAVADLVAADTTPPDFVSNLALSADGATLTGHGEAGADVTVNVIDTNGTVLGTGVVDADGRFAITLDPPATPGLPLGIVQVDANGNASPALTFDVPAIPAPQTPTQLLLADDGLSLSGVGSVGSTVQVYGPNGLLLGSAAVLADGTFNVTLNSRQANGERLEISAEGAAGTLSLPATLQAPDLIAPQPLTQLSLSADGLVLSGKGEAGATVSVSGSGGLTLGTAQVAADGSFSVTFDAAQLNGERLDATQADAAGNTSDSITLQAPDRTAPEAPADLRLTSGGGVLLGTGEAGAQVSVLDADGALLGSATVLLNGTFEVALTPLQANGQILHVVLTDAAGNRSAATDLTAPDTTAPALLRDVSISADGVTLTGRGEVAAVVTVRNTAGEPLGTATVDASGNFSLTLTPALTNAEALSLVQADAAGNLSPVLVLNTPDFTPPEPLSAVRISVDGSVVTGRGEPGSTVTVRDATGQVLGSGLVQPDETFRVELNPPQINNQILDVQQADPPGNLSQAVQVIAPDRTPPVAPDNLALNGAGNQLSGTGEAGTTVKVSLGGLTIGTASVGADGRFVVQLEVAQRNGERLQVTLEDASQNVSLPTSLVALDVTPPAQVVASLNADGTQISGSGEAGARVTVVNDLGNVVAQGVIDDEGRFVLDLAAAQQNGEVLSVVAQDATGNPSTPLLLTAQDLTPPTPLLGLSLNAAGTLLSGTGEVGSTVTVRAASGAVLGEVQVPTGGAFVVPITPAQLNGQTLTVSATDAAGNTSDAQTVVALDVTPPALVTNLSIDTGYELLVGRGEVGATVRVVEGNTTLGSAIVATNGTFQVVLAPPATPGAALLVTQTDVAGNPSLAETFNTPLEPVPAAPTDVLLSADGLVVSGLATAGSEVRVYDNAGVQLGIAVATPQGIFEIILAQAQLNGQRLEVTASSSGGQSQPFVLMALDTTPPAQPVVTSLSGNGLVLSGSGEAGATVTVRSALGATLGTALVTAAGTFAVTLSSPQLNGQTLNVQQTDAAGNGSTVLDYSVPDVQAPGAPGNLQLLDGGLRLVGTGEAGALVSVSGRGGVSLGSVQVGANGQFELTLPSAQLDGQVLTVRQADRAGNLSASATLTAADTTAPTAPSVAINAAGTVLTGTGEAGTRVIVRSNGAVVGSATVAANGTYVVTLTTPQANFETLNVTLTDGAGNVSPVSTVVAPDFTPPSLAGNLLVNATGTLLTGSGEVGASVTVRGADGSVLQSGVVIGATGLFSVVLSPAQDNGQALTVSLTDPRGNVSANATVVAPDIDVNLPVVASDNLATAVVNLAPVVVTQAPVNDSYTLLVGLNTSKTFNWTVAAGTTANPTLTLSTDNLLGLLNSSTFTLQVKNASGAWVDIASANDSALLTLVLLPGVGLRATIGTLQAGDYRLVTSSGGLSVLTTVSTRLDIETTSLTQFAGTGTALAGNVVSDLGVDGTTDILGPDSGAVLQVLKAGSYVTAGAGTTVQGQYGSLLIRADGSYTYTPNGSTASVGKVDVFSYQLAHPNGKSDTANLYVRIDSPQATEVWNDSNLAAPARLVDAVDDVGRSNVVLANKVTTATQDFARIDLPALAGVKSSVLGHTVAAGTTADLQVVLTSTNLLALLGGASVQLQKLNASGQYVTVQTVNGNDLLSLVNNTARGYTFANQSAGTYQVTVKASGLLGLGSSLSSTLNTSTKSLTEFVVDRSSVATGNLLTGDTLGSNLTTLSVQTAANTYAVPGYNGISVVGLYGILLVQADGSYSYTLKPGLAGSVVGQVDQFTYALTHPNGSVDTAQLKITVAEGEVTGVQRLAALDDTPEATLLMAAAAETHEQSAQAVSDDPRDVSTADDGADAAATTDAPLGEDAFAQVEDAAEGTTLLWQGGDASIDLGSLVGQVQDLEVLDLNATSAVSLSISLEDVLALNDGAGSPLLIKGDSADSVLLGEQWSLAGQGVADGIDYDQYTAQQDPSQQLWIQNSVHVV